MLCARAVQYLIDDDLAAMSSDKLSLAEKATVFRMSAATIQGAESRWSLQRRADEAEAAAAQRRRGYGSVEYDSDAGSGGWDHGDREEQEVLAALERQNGGDEDFDLLDESLVKQEAEDDAAPAGASAAAASRQRAVVQTKSAYLFFLDDREARLDYLAAHPELKGDMSQSHSSSEYTCTSPCIRVHAMLTAVRICSSAAVKVTMAVAAQWKALNADGRRKYEDMADAARKEAVAARLAGTNDSNDDEDEKGEDAIVSTWKAIAGTPAAAAALRLTGSKKRRHIIVSSSDEEEEEEKSHHSHHSTAEQKDGESEPETAPAADEAAADSSSADEPRPMDIDE